MLFKVRCPKRAYWIALLGSDPELFTETKASLVGQVKNKRSRGRSPRRGGALVMARRSRAVAPPKSPSQRPAITTTSTCRPTPWTTRPSPTRANRCWTGCRRRSACSSGGWPRLPRRRASRSRSQRTRRNAPDWVGSPGWRGVGGNGGARVRRTPPITRSRRTAAAWGLHCTSSYERCVICNVCSQEIVETLNE